jgi:hypothetical protein
MMGALGLSLPAQAVSKNPYNRKKAKVTAPVKVPALAQLDSSKVGAKPKDNDPTSSWQPYSFP